MIINNISFFLITSVHLCYLTNPYFPLTWNCPIWSSCVVSFYRAVQWYRDWDNDKRLHFLACPYWAHPIKGSINPCRINSNFRFVSSGPGKMMEPYSLMCLLSGFDALEGLYRGVAPCSCSRASNSVISVTTPTAIIDLSYPTHQIYQSTNKSICPLNSQCHFCRYTTPF